jgi:hypothetical protein
VAGFAPLIAGRQSPERLAAHLGELDSPAFAGHSELRWPVPPSTSPEEPGFHPRSYWRGPVWPVANWLLWWSLIRAGETERAAQIRRSSLDQIAEGGFAEYFEPFSGGTMGYGMMGGMGQMMSGSMMGSSLLGMLFALLFWVLVIALIVALVVWIVNQTQRR